MATIIRRYNLNVEIYFRDMDAIELILPVDTEHKEGDILSKILSQLTTFELRSLQKLKIINTGMTPWLFNSGGWIYFDKRNLKAWSNYILLNEFITNRGSGGDL